MDNADRPPRAAAMLLLGGALLLTGCGASPDQAVPGTRAYRDPRQAFEQIVDQFKHQYTGGAIAVRTRLGSEGERRRLVLRFRVDDVRYTIRGCERASEPCTAEMTIRTSTHSSLQRARRAEDETNGVDKSGEDTPGKSGSDPSASADQSKTSSVTDTLVAEKVLREQDKAREQTCLFSYEGGRWVLLSDLPDGSLRRAIELALDNQ